MIKQTFLIPIQNIVLSIFISVTSLAVQASSLSITTSSSIISVGQTFSVDININDATDLYSYNTNFFYNPGILSINKISEGALLSSGGATNFNSGTIDASQAFVSGVGGNLIGSVPGVSGSGILATIYFTAIAPGISGNNVYPTVFLNSSGSTIPLDYNGNVFFTTQVNPVPIPAAVWLLGSAFMGLLGFKNLRV